MEIEEHPSTSTPQAIHTIAGTGPAQVSKHLMTQRFCVLACLSLSGSST